MNDKMELKNTPWLTNESIKFLDDNIASGQIKNILEFGSGSSTVWFAKQKIDKLISIEINKQWFEITNKAISQLANSNKVEIRLVEHGFAQLDDLENESFDLILIDGSDRIYYTRKSIPLLKEGGIIMLDNAERLEYKNIYEMLKDWEFVSTKISTKNENWQTNFWKKPIMPS